MALPPNQPPRLKRASAEYSVVGGAQVPRIPAESVPSAPSAPPAPPRSASPSPESVGVRVTIPELGFDAKVRGGALKRLGPWLVPLVLSALGTIGGGVLGYFEGLKRAAARVAALELQVDAAKELLRQEQKDADRLFAVQQDHDRRLLTVERQLKLDTVVVRPGQ